MLTRRLARVAPMRNALLGARLPITQKRGLLPPEMSDRKILDEKYPDYPSLTDAEDPGMNGGYVNPPFVKRQFRDPYGTWTDPQERRNWGEPVHEDDDMLGMMSPYDYTWLPEWKVWSLLGAFSAVMLSLVGVVYMVYPEPVAWPREFEGGLERELGGPGSLRARMEGDPIKVYKK